MNFFESCENLHLLQKLLNPNDSDSDEDDDHLPKSNVQHLSPNDLAKSVTNEASTSDRTVAIPQTTLKPPHPPGPTTIDEWEEREALLNEEELDKRLCPNYNIIYKQSVTPEDVYLQMSSKTPTTSSCEEMCLEIAMPEENVGIDGMDLKISSDSIDLKTPVYRLKLPLVQSIDPDRGRAVWDTERKMLILTLRMKREYDFINF